MDNLVMEISRKISYAVNNSIEEFIKAEITEEYPELYLYTFNIEKIASAIRKQMGERVDANKKGKKFTIDDYAVNPKEIDYVYNVLEICTCHDEENTAFCSRPVWMRCCYGSEYH